MNPAGYYGRKNISTRDRQSWVHLLTSCVMQGKLMNITDISFLICEMKVL